MRPRSACLLTVVLAASSILSSPPLVRAQSGVDRAAAEALFQDGLKLMEQGKHDVACPKLQESHRLEPALGTLLYLADCQERAGLFASAWTNFLEAQALAKAAGQGEREKAAKRRATLLGPKIHKLAVDLAEALPEGAVVRRNDTVLGAVSIGTLLPVDPGAYVVEASAPGHEPFKKSLQVPSSSGETHVVVPRLVRTEATASGAGSTSPAPPPVLPTPQVPLAPPSVSSAGGSAAPPALPPPGTRGGLVPIYVAGGVGGVAIVFGTVFGARAFGQWDTSNQHCPRGACDQEGVDAAQRAKSAATFSTIGFVLGAVGVGAGITLWAIRSGPRGTGGGVALAAQPAGASLQGAF